MLHIALSGEELFRIGSFIITNTLLTTWVVMAIMAALSLYVSKNMTLVPGRFQVFIEFAIGGLYGMFEGILGSNIKKYFPILASFFMFIIISSWFGLLPGVGTAIGLTKSESLNEEAVSNGKYEEESESGHGGKESAIPLFRAPTADLNTTLALALISVVMIQFAGFKSLGASYSKKFFNFSGGIQFFVGFLETISEFGKIISFAFRLYGNIFAGEVLIGVIAFLVPVIATVPFLGLEIFVGFIQALVFSMLTTVFLSVATIHQEH